MRDCFVISLEKRLQEEFIFIVTQDAELLYFTAYIRNLFEISFVRYVLQRYIFCAEKMQARLIYFFALQPAEFSRSEIN